MNNGKMLLSMVASVATGLALGMLYAPDSGANTRRKIMRKGEGYAGEIKDGYKNLINSVSNEMDEITDDYKHFVPNRDDKKQDANMKTNTIKSIS